MGKIALALFITLISVTQSEFARGEGHLEFSGKAIYIKQPVRDATVTLYALGETKEKVATETTGYNGTFSFRLAFDKMYRIEWRKEGYTEMVILINGFVPASEKGWIMSYTVNFEIFKHKEGHETQMANDPIIQVSYSAKKKNFSQVTEYTNTSTYLRIGGDEQPTPSEKNTESTKEEKKVAIEEVPTTEEEKKFVKKTEEQEKHAEFKKEIAESAASENQAKELAIKQQEKSLDKKRMEELKASRLKESLVREKELARKEVIKNRSARSNAQQNLMMEIADMMKEEKQKKP